MGKADGKRYHTFCNQMRRSLLKTEERKGGNRFSTVHHNLFTSFVLLANPSEIWGASCPGPKAVSFLLYCLTDHREPRSRTAGPLISPRFNLATFCIVTEDKEGGEDKVRGGEGPRKHMERG